MVSILERKFGGSEELGEQRPMGDDGFGGGVTVGKGDFTEVSIRQKSGGGRNTQSDLPLEPNKVHHKRV